MLPRVSAIQNDSGCGRGHQNHVPQAVLGAIFDREVLAQELLPPVVCHHFVEVCHLALVLRNRLVNVLLRIDLTIKMKEPMSPF